jgi:hypothetical protein
MARLNCLWILAAAVTLLVPATALSIPAFAREYAYNCNICHVAFPKLNDFGERFRDNGYQVPGGGEGGHTIFEGHSPFTMRTAPGLAYYDIEDGSTIGFDIFGLDLQAAGLMRTNLAFLFMYTPRIDEPSADFAGTSDDDVEPAQEAELEAVNLVFSNIIEDMLNVRVGRFEPAYRPLSSHRSYYLFAPYEVYEFTTPSNSFVFDDNQIGLEATGRWSDGFKYAAGVVNGTGGYADNNEAKDLYVTVSKTLGPGEGQTSGQRIDLFTYYGWQPTGLPGPVTSPTGETDGTCNVSFCRIGAAGSLNWKSLNLRGLFLKGQDDEGLNASHPGEKYTYTGGLVEVDWVGLPDNSLVASGMYNWVRPPSYDSDRKVSAFAALVRYYVGTMKAVNMALHAEYSHRRTGKHQPFKENQIEVVLDFWL